jgi:hypothetical protein
LKAALISFISVGVGPVLIGSGPPADTLPGIRPAGRGQPAPCQDAALLQDAELLHQNLKRVGWDPARIPPITEDWQKLVAHPGIDIVIEATGNPPAAVEHALAAFRNKKHVVMVTVEADAFCGPLLAKKAAEAGSSTRFSVVEARLFG